ncbi:MULTISPECIES: carbohydrate ABC transporter permease [Clostridium]|uniref:Multiple sugar transport system permease protein n=1 Tax=Clostridium cadaveris TaxID=1529 RepID=A0A1I2MIQ8_9CLOT|nr:sugar ABC transporter permease [Clostridium cadaveris]MDU4951899.1 sugar ABC transporter permease [Clostridium sp.]MDM8311255.1 sugar ABC transporter permease [Clostridium cadaveris]NWK11008.1 sugar ABC transporter permease [Clostridium cadaveris]PWL51270.1 MAG: sugar ABC transporter permease [Clostridium cadaveris]SFF91384.1 multiple sugar transport system permease protein [Clostridium cadaveris]
MKKFKYRAENSPQAWLFLLPALIIVGIFSVLPLIKTFVMSFQKGTLNNLQFNGFKNFEIVLSDPKFHTALINTALYAFIVVPVGLIIAMFIAITIHDKIKHKDICETIFFIPYLTSIIAVGIVFRYLLNGEYGFVNYILEIFNVGPINFLDDPSMSMTTLIIFGIWSGLAFNIIILLSGLRNVDSNYYKVADMFGATKIQQFFRITLPQMIPIITFLLMVNFISAFKVYAQVFAIFNGKAGIADSATTAVFYIFNKFYVENRYGQGMAAAVILFILILLFTVIQNRILKRISK